MNRVHNILCSSGWWSRQVERELVPWGLDGVAMGDDVLEIGAGSARPRAYWRAGLTA
jgi:hypothetical protein